MIAWINLAVLLLATFLTWISYVKSAGLAALAQKIGVTAYARCTRYRMVSSIFMTLAGIDYFLYAFYPIPLPLPRFFPWPYWISILLAAIIAVPSGMLNDAGHERRRRGNHMGQERA